MRKVSILTAGVHVSERVCEILWASPVSLKIQKFVNFFLFSYPRFKIM